MSTNINDEPIRYSKRCFSGLCGFGCFSGLGGMLWCFGGVLVDFVVWDTSVDRWLQVFQGTGWYGMVFGGCFSGPVVTGVSRDGLGGMVWSFGGVSVDRWLEVFQGTGWYSVLGVFQWKGSYRCFKGLGGMVF